MASNLFSVLYNQSVSIITSIKTQNHIQKKTAINYHYNILIDYIYTAANIVYKKTQFYWRNKHSVHHYYASPDVEYYFESIVWF
jgi:hypothetical protein